ncbi:hypothetical protein [Sporisorium scitamineum]|uniref:Uncharacterized protein n=1 Tax=Sporisorium scitamineum TaxID=49012 RepID=A0A0F7RTJ9_9BASI|nr:hypothetical protein [Sporisorium scitamineum]
MDSNTLRHLRVPTTSLHSRQRASTTATPVFASPSAKRAKAKTPVAAAATAEQEPVVKHPPS